MTQPNINLPLLQYFLALSPSKATKQIVKYSGLAIYFIDYTTWSQVISVHRDLEAFIYRKKNPDYVFAYIKPGFPSMSL